MPKSKGLLLRLSRRYLEVALNPSQARNDLQVYLMYHVVIAVLLIALIALIVRQHEALAWGCLIVIAVPVIAVAVTLLMGRGTREDSKSDPPAGPDIVLASPQANDSKDENTLSKAA